MFWTGVWAVLHFPLLYKLHIFYVSLNLYFGSFTLCWTVFCVRCLWIIMFEIDWMCHDMIPISKIYTNMTWDCRMLYKVWRYTVNIMHYPVHWRGFCNTCQRCPYLGLLIRFSIGHSQHIIYIHNMSYFSPRGTFPNKFRGHLPTSQRGRIWNFIYILFKEHSNMSGIATLPDCHLSLDGNNSQMLMSSTCSPHWFRRYP